MQYHYAKINIVNKKDVVYDGKGEIIDGNNRYVHLLRIHNGENITIQNAVFRRGNTNVLKYIQRNQIGFNTVMGSVFEIIDGGAVVITGRSSVTFCNCTFEDNCSLLCGGAVSNQSLGIVSFERCLFKNNAAGHTGAAIDNLTKRATVKVSGCTFINNKSNCWHNAGAPHGQITVFRGTHAEIAHSTFKNGSIPVDYVDDNDIVLVNNKYEGFDFWKPRRHEGQRKSLIDYLKMARKLYWVLPKTIGKVYYSVAKDGGKVPRNRKVQ